MARLRFTRARSVPRRKPSLRVLTTFSDNLSIERLRRIVKYGKVFLETHHYVGNTWVVIGDYFRFDNTERPHRALSYRTPAEVFSSIPLEATKVCIPKSSILNTTWTARLNLNIYRLYPFLNSVSSSRFRLEEIGG